MKYRTLDDVEAEYEARRATMPAGQDRDGQEPDRVTGSTLQRESKVPRGGGRGAGKTAAKKRKYVPKRASIPENERPVGGERFRISGLSAGEREFYARDGRSGQGSPGVARRELRKACAEIRKGDDAYPFIQGLAMRTLREPRTSSRRKCRGGDDLIVYGLAPEDIELLNTHPGFARLILSSYAKWKDPKWLRAIDGDVPERTF